MQDQMQQLQAQINSLKVRLFDANEAAAAQNEQMSGVLQQLVNIMAVKGDENGNVTLEMIIARAQELADNEAAPVEDNVIPFTKPIAPEAE
ncbi:MAG: hypothetical protein ACRC9Y_13440 [Aeromonas veronii]